ncbi:MAG: putative nucleoside transporter YegT [Phycisphaerales bacterium]|nr:putative nucleoside transporter YegT [Phycisphaerales bacterium]
MTQTGASHDHPHSATGGTTIKLSAMMFLQFFLWGAWFVTLGPFLVNRQADASTIGNAYTTAPIGAILAPVFLGMIADRFFATQLVLGVLHLVGGALLLLAPSVAPASQGDSPWLFIGVLLAHMLCYMPTLGLTNTLAFHHMTDPEKQFPKVRVLGTIGWIAAGMAVAFAAQLVVPDDAAPADKLEALRAAKPHFFYIAGVSGILLGLYSFFLPHTPPPARGKPFSLSTALGFEAISLLKDRNFLIFILASFLVCIPLAAYYSFAATYAGKAGMANVPFKMTFGQMSEIFFMLVMPLFFARLGVKWMLAVGMLAWVIRYGLFAGAWDPVGGNHVMWMILAGIVLHGICYDFFFVTGFIYVDKKCPTTVRGQAQGLLVLVTQGLGMFVGNQVFPRIVNAFTTKGGPEGGDVVDWRMVWIVPSGAALLILIGFVLTFRNGVSRSPEEAS